MDVGIRELKKRLSEYVEMASKGEHVRVTLRGQPVAHLGPIPGRLRLEEGIAEGWVTPATVAPRLTVKSVPGDRSISEVIAEDRGP
ncbi:MAG: type II toxin-antitoxin system prevent-host-death family antitoxin [Acidimicrobiia bacterium]